MDGGEFMGMDLSVFESNEPALEPEVVQTEDTEPEQSVETEGNVETQQPEQEEFKIDEKWFTPEDFENDPVKELNWYKNRVETLRNAYNDLYVDRPQEHINQLLEQTSNEIEGFKIAFNALKTNPEEFVMQYMPELLAKHGLSPVLSEDQILNKVHEQLVKEFGEDYRNRYDPSELIDMRSFSAQMLNKQNQLYGEYAELNKRNAEIATKWNENINEKGTNFQTQEQAQFNVQEIAEKHYGEFEQLGFNREEYNSFIEAAQQQDLTMQDIHKVVYFDGYMQVAYEKGLEEGRKNIYNKLKSENNAQPVDANQHVESTPKPNQNFVRALFGDETRIPMY